MYTIKTIRELKGFNNYTRLLYTDYLLPVTFGRARNSNRKAAIVSYTVLNHTSKNGKLHTIAVGSTRLN